MCVNEGTKNTNTISFIRYVYKRTQPSLYVSNIL
jgi:hypothetical protein